MSFRDLRDLWAHVAAPHYNRLDLMLAKCRLGTDRCAWNTSCCSCARQASSTIHATSLKRPNAPTPPGSWPLPSLSIGRRDNSHFRQDHFVYVHWYALRTGGSLPSRRAPSLSEMRHSLLLVTTTRLTAAAAASDPLRSRLLLILW